MTYFRTSNNDLHILNISQTFVKSLFSGNFRNNDNIQTIPGSLNTILGTSHYHSQPAYHFYQKASAIDERNNYPIIDVSNTNNNSNSLTSPSSSSEITATQKNLSDENLFKSYSNSNYGLGMQYPNNWTKREAKDSVTFYPLLGNKSGQFQANFKITLLPTTGAPLAEKVSTAIVQLKQNLTNFELKDSLAADNISSNQAYKILYTYKQGAALKDLEAVEYWTIVGDKTYVVKYTAEQNQEYSKYLPTIQKMVRSIDIQNAEVLNPGLLNTTEQLDQLGFRTGVEPYYVSMNPITNRLYVANYRSNTVSVIDGLTDKLITNIAVGNLPTSIDFNPFTNIIYVTNSASNTVSVIDGPSNKVVATIKVGENPSEVIVDAIEGKLNSLIFVANDGSNNVSVINGLTNKLMYNITVGDGPASLAIDSVVDRLYVANSDSNTVNVIDYFTAKVGGFRDKMISNITVGTFPSSLGLNPNTNRLYVANKLSNTVSVIDVISNRLITNVEVGKLPSSIGINTETNTTYVANYGSNTISIIKGKNNTASTTVYDIPSGRLPFDIEVVPENNIAYVTNLGSATISEIDLTSNKLLAGVTFAINPSDAGYIQCNGSDISPSYIRYEMDSGLQCDAVPNRGYDFSFWSGNLSSYTSAVADNPTGSTISFKVSHYGKLSANFVLPPNVSIPKEYLNGLYALGAAILVGWFVPNIAKAINKAIQIRRFNNYKNDVETAGDDWQSLNRLRNKIREAYAKGKISEAQFNMLDIIFQSKK
jgi:YVTN family beta-propeller protein